MIQTTGIKNYMVKQGIHQFDAVRGKRVTHVTISSPTHASHRVLLGATFSTNKGNATALYTLGQNNAPDYAFVNRKGRVFWSKLTNLSPYPAPSDTKGGERLDPDKFKRTFFNTTGINFDEIKALFTKALNRQLAK